MSQVKVPLIVFVAVFFISGLLGFFSGSSYLGMLLKAVVSALVSATFVFTSKFLLQKYVPDMFENGDGIDGVDSPVMGTNVDVRLAGDESSPISVPLSTPQSNSTNSDEMASMEGLVDDSLTQEDPLSDVELEEPNFQPMSFSPAKSSEASVGASEVASSSVAQKADDSTEKKTQNEIAEGAKVAEEVPFAKQEKNLTASNASERGHDAKEDEEQLADTIQAPSVPTLQQEVDERAEDEERLSEAELDQAMEKDVDRLEELPDLHEFVDAAAIAKQSKAEELMNSGTQSFFETNLSEDVGVDSKLMANAIRTVLRRE